MKILCRNDIVSLKINYANLSYNIEMNCSIRGVVSM